MAGRRRFLIAGTAAALSTSLALWFRVSSKGPPGAREQPLKGLRRDPKKVLDLAEGFRYRVLERAGDAMDDGYRVPARPDAMGCFDLKNGTWALMRNHELDSSLFAYGPYAGLPAPPQAYDKSSVGGVTRLLLNTSGGRISSNLVLTGTARNCAGGVSPWGWLTCEESVQPGHGYVFACAPQASSVRPPQRISAYGRFLHEAVAIDPPTMAAYLTEDRKDSCLYRFVPASITEPHGKGRLQALAVAGKPGFALSEGLNVGSELPVNWVDVPAQAGEDDSLRQRAQELGAAVVVRGEGIVRLNDGFAFTSTEGGPMDSGQVFHLAPTEGGGTLRLLAQSEGDSALDMPDNITVTPWGDLLVCEDNHRRPHLRIITRGGAVLPFAHNAQSNSEFAGACFSPDGRILFVNIQEEGLTLAITGPWQKFSTQA